MIFLAVMLALNGLAADDTKPKSPDAMACDLVNSYIRDYGEKVALEWAKAHGWSAERIEEARKCRHRN